MQRAWIRTSILAMLLLPLTVFAAGGQTAASANQEKTAEMQQQQAEMQERRADMERRAAEVKKKAAEVDRDKLERQLRDAQAKLQELAQRVARLSLQLSGPEVDGGREFHIYRHLRQFDDNQAILGITILESRHEKTPSDGVKVAAVTPDGPAEKAGLRAGDVITAIDGKSMHADKSNTADSKLLDLMGHVAPGQQLAVDYDRAGKHLKTRVTAGKLDIGNLAFAFGGPPEPPNPLGAPPPPPVLLGSPMPDVPPVPHSMDKFLWYLNTDDITGDMQLVPLSKDLGQYFGTDKGLLVIHAGRHNELKLKDGDVILKIGGREPGTPPHAMRILRSYGPGDSLTLNVMRRGKPVSLKLKIPSNSTASGAEGRLRRHERIVTRTSRAGA